MSDTRVWPEIIGIGSTVYDTLMVISRYPTEDTKLEGLETKVQGGGPCATALVAARKLGATAAYMGTIGTDPFGTFMMDDMKQWDIDTDSVRRVDGAISFHSTVLLNRENGSRTCIWNRGTVPQPTPKELDYEKLSHAKVLHCDGHMLRAAVAAATFCRAHGVKVSHDAGGTYPGVEELMKYVDWLIPSEEFALKMTGKATAEEAIRALYDTYHPELIIVTQGVNGGLLLDEKGLRHYDCYRVEVKDSNGCGDTFHGAFVAAKLKGMDNDTACKYASAAAAIKCTRLGARYAMATDAECRAFLMERGAEI